MGCHHDRHAKQNKLPLTYLKELMKTTLRFEMTHSMAACLALLLLGGATTRGGETNDPSNPPNDPSNPHIIVMSAEEFSRSMQLAETNPPPPRPDVKWGEATNGLRCGISSLYSWVFIETPLTNIPYPNSSLVMTNALTQRPPRVIGYGPGDSNPDSPVWIGSPNGFFGPMELRNANGEKMPLLKPEANNPSYYPEFLRWSILRPQMSGGVALGNPNGPHVGQWQEFQRYRDVQQAGGMLRNLKSIFEVKEPGEYQLTLWPKIYKRSEKPDEDHDIYQLINVPPVTVTIKWAGK